MSWYKYEVETVDTSGADAIIQVIRYVDGVADEPFVMHHNQWSNIWKNFDDMIRVQYNSAYLRWWVEILSDSIEDYSIGDVVSWSYSESKSYTFTEAEPTPPPPVGDGFDVHLMNNTDELNKILKSPTLVMTLHGFLREQTDIVDPEIMIEYEGVLVNCNYMHIPVFNRYYFITKIESVRTNLWRIYAHCDVLKTYAEGILDTEAVVARSENRYNLFLNDSMYKVNSNPRLQIANFPGKFTGESYVLVMNGAQWSSS